ncbi:MAG: RecQ family ATP-dependent DNA helicase, partial [Thermodesulfobacteriota bacterium]|nr:RecQ family ATP-dependent DNA helicase [Thermodesulfobacteriota bacterium]
MRFLKRCVLIDLEVAGQNRIVHVGALRGDAKFEQRNGFGMPDGLAGFDRFCNGAEFILGHNILNHDLPVLASFNPELKLLNLPVIDTLYLSPLAFPENPYHRLVKDYKLVRDSINNPVADARLAGLVFTDQRESFSGLIRRHPDIPAFYHYCFSSACSAGKFRDHHGTAAVFEIMGVKPVRSKEDAFQIFKDAVLGAVCPTQFENTIPQYLSDPDARPCLAYCLAWLMIAGGNSVLPPWVRHRFPDVALILKNFRDKPCADERCPWCSDVHNPVKQLHKYFQYDDFRKLPDGRNLQKKIVSQGMADTPLLGILPTGFGKS